MTATLTARHRRHDDDDGDDNDNGDDNDGSGRHGFRPVPPARGAGRLLRRVAGVNEAVLDWVPEERPRYTRLGAIVVNTGLMAALSMAVLLSKVHLPVWLIPPIALIWGYLILSFDGWLVASTHGILNVAKLRLYLPRLIISVLMGAVIAEPLLLWAFGPAIETQVRDQRKALIEGYESRLRQCNPLDGVPVGDAGCGDALVNVDNPLVAMRKQAADKTAERDRLKTRIAEIETELARREEIARLECNGTPGAGRTGRVGEGPNCRQNRRETEEFRKASNIGQHQTALVALNGEIDDLADRQSELGTGYAEAVSAEITKKVAEMRGNRQGVGILDEDRALGELSAQSSFVLIGSWLLRLLLIAIDCLPVLTKLMSSTTNYDMLVTRQLDSSNRLHDKYTSEREQRDGGRVDVAIRRNEHSVRTQMDQIDDAYRTARVEQEAQLDDEIDRLASRLRNDEQ